ncbi:MAG: SDR family NAD(P)-dependent oxidoreductase, partial [Pseudomonadota bacterium]
KQTDFDKMRAANNGKGSITPLAMDVTDTEQLEAAAQTIAEVSGEGGVKGIITCQGLTPSNFIEFFEIDQLNAAYDVQLNGNIRMFQAFAKMLRTNGDARFVMLSSPMNHLGLPTMGSNALNRGATEGLANTLRLETAGQGIHVSVIWPLGIRGGTVAEVEEQLAAIGQKTQEDPDWMPYASAFDAFMKFKASMAWDTGEFGPEVVIPAALDALTSMAPEFRYTVGKGPAGNALPPPSRGFYDAYLASFTL